MLREYRKTATIKAEQFTEEPEQVFKYGMFPGIHISVYQSLDTLLKNIDSDDFVELYVTGLTSVTIEAIQYLIEHKIVYKSMHFDRDTGGYIEQPGLTRI